MKNLQNLTEINSLACPICECTMLDSQEKLNNITSHYCYKCEYEWDIEKVELEEEILYFATS